eukprot:gnl/MRDRNA2_/MRDRNA2_118649_c0_seq1.p1 gnl/MRDRNA2_/MRDRNA2_118649_c0~~gnl/MRDRNA2_/MRDRNA2_118649_c0_seq1.p1  ORF type:complete len:177 (+),score=14.09 gnl/MRDRNA2_/MRDRNA2_118649_c0_seq1:2-532(+)
MNQRKQLMEVTGEPYICFGGMGPGCPCCPTEQEVPCLCIESFCFPQIALSANRYIIQTRFGLQDTQCDECLFTLTSCLACCANCAQCLRCLRDCFGFDIPGGLDDCLIDHADEITQCANVVILSVSCCMFAQQEAEIAEIRASGYNRPSEALISLLPPKQQEMIQRGHANLPLREH